MYADLVITNHKSMEWEKAELANFFYILESLSNNNDEL